MNLNALKDELTRDEGKRLSVVAQPVARRTHPFNAERFMDANK